MKFFREECPSPFHVEFFWFEPPPSPHPLPRATPLTEIYDGVLCISKSWPGAASLASKDRAIIILTYTFCSLLCVCAKLFVSHSSPPFDSRNWTFLSLFPLLPSPLTWQPVWLCKVPRYSISFHSNCSGTNFSIGSSVLIRDRSSCTLFLCILAKTQPLFVVCWKFQFCLILNFKNVSF